MSKMWERQNKGNLWLGAMIRVRERTTGFDGCKKCIKSTTPSTESFGEKINKALFEI